MEKLVFEYNADKNLKLLNERGIGFEDAIAILDAQGCIGIINHPNSRKYPNQKIYLIEIDGYIYQVPFEQHDNKIILKTIFASRKMTHLYQKMLKEVNNYDEDNEK